MKENVVQYKTSDHEFADMCVKRLSHIVCEQPIPPVSKTDVHQNLVQYNRSDHKISNMCVKRLSPIAYEQPIPPVRKINDTVSSNVRPASNRKKIRNCCAKNCISEGDNLHTFPAIVKDGKFIKSALDR